MNSIQLFIDGKEYKNATFPFKYGNFLDEQLDYATITLTRVKKEYFAPTTPVRVIINQGKKTITLDYIVAQDNFRETPVGSGEFRHQLTLIEPTKLLEGITVETLCFTNPGATVYSEKIKPFIEIRENDIIAEDKKIKPVLPVTIETPTATRQIELPSARDFMNVAQGYVIGGTVSIRSNTGEKNFEISNNGAGVDYSADDKISLILDPGINIVQYDMGYRQIAGAANSYSFIALFSISVIEKQLYPLIPWTIRDVIDRVLETERPLVWDTANGYAVKPRFKRGDSEIIEKNVNYTYEGYEKYSFGTVVTGTLGREIKKVEILDPQNIGCSYKINGDTATISGVATGDVQTTIKVALIYDEKLYEALKQPAPEFTFTRMTLREVLKTIGGYIHAEPRLLYNESTKEFDTIIFDFLGEQTYAEYYDAQENKYKRYSDLKYADFSGNYGIEQACTSLDGYVENLVNQIKATSSTIGQPYEGGVQNFRTETANVRVEEGNLYFPTAYPVSKIHKFSWIQETTDENGVKTYNRIDLTPYLFEETIYNSQLSSYDGVYPTSKAYGLYYKQNQKGIHGFFWEAPTWDSTGYLSQYAIKNIMSIVVPDDAKNLSGLESYLRLGFELVYTPVYSARIAHSKSYVGDWLKHPRTLNYSQGANMVEAEYYGENIKGAVERLGTLEKVYTFFCSGDILPPTPGQLWDDEYYISTVSVEVVQDRSKVTVGLSKNFNRISQYIGVSSYKRIYEVSEVMVQSRETMYKDYVVITDYDKQFAGKYSNDLVSSYRSDECFLCPNNASMAAIKNTFLQSQNNTYGRIAYAYAQGFRYNFDPLPAVTLPVIASAQGNVMQFTWEYKDNYSAGVKLVSQLVNGATNYYTQDVQYSDYYGRMYYERFALRPVGEIDNGSRMYDYPQMEDEGADILNQAANAYIIRRKDSRETLKHNYAIEFVTDNSSFIVGSALAESCPMVAGINGNPAKLVLLKNRINKFSKKVDLSEDNVLYERATVADDFAGSYAKCILCKGVSIEDTDLLAKVKAWAYVTPVRAGAEIEYAKEDGTTVKTTSSYGGDLLIGYNLPSGQALTENVGAFMMLPTHDIYEYLKQKSELTK